ncbi:MAG TPA: class I SAM-dependent methyltransferase [Hanamia sp.]|nr:class I SAM-dependent methyltransferase [Hanamia sp.]
MDREKVILTLMKQKKLSHYLEIGVFNGHIFFRVKSTFKIAVDPDFQFDTLRKTGKLFLNPYNLFNKYFEKTSDDFFTEDAPGLLSDRKLEIALIDGMHEYAYALRDVENSLNYLSDHGVIVLHDCNPRVKADSVSFEEWKARNFTGTWNGDVWRALLHLRSLRDDINVFTLDCDHGLGIVTIGKPENKLNYTLEQINKFTFEDFDANRTSWINLKPVEYFYEYFQFEK